MTIVLFFPLQSVHCQYFLTETALTIQQDLDSQKVVNQALMLVISTFMLVTLLDLSRMQIPQSAIARKDLTNAVKPVHIISILWQKKTESKI